MPFDKGSLILANFTAKIKETGEGVDTTVEEDAKKLGMHDPTRKYEPRLVAVGDSWVLQGVDEALAKADAGQKVSIEVSPEKGFGTRDPAKVRLVPIRRFGDKADQLSIGAEIEVDGRIGIVKLMGSGRVQLDFNHKYAGKVLLYDIEVVKALSADDEKIKALLHRRLPIEIDKVELTLDGSSASIKLPSDTYLLEGLQIIKRAITNDIFKYVKSVEKVLFVEEYLSQKPKEEPKPEVKEAKETEAKVEAPAPS
ncbi:MAG: peptidylprolyl isomerase [Thaumarchaeota archaeon]|nr:peptidylprolyl isomerase [Nitrososphaerota archaeon]